MVRRYPDALIFCSWPSLEETWYRQALKAMRVGQRIVAVIEDSCAEESAREYFDACFEIERLIPIPAFEYMNDIAIVATKKRPRIT
jgi:16S rRNA G1207 methylase RsmC